MKILFPDDQKRCITISQIPAVKKMIADFKKTKNMNWEASSAARLVSGTECEILKCTAEIAKNCRIWNFYGDSENSSEDIDIWLRIKAFDEFAGFYVIGCYLSDIWSLCHNTYNETKSHMHVRHYKEEV